MSGGIIAFPIRVCHGLDSNILDKLLTWWYRNKKKSVIMVFTRVREATSFYCRTSGIVSSMCEKEFFLSSQRFFHIPKGGRESRPASVFFFLPIWHKTTIHDYSCRSCLLLMFSLIFFLPRLSDVTVMESPRIHVGQTGQRGRMNTLRTSSIIRSGIGISVIRFSSLRLICFNLGASFFSYAVSFIGLGHNTFLSTAIYMSRLGQHTQWFMCPFLRLNSFLRKILNDSANSPVMSEKVMSFVLRDSMNCLRLSCVVFDWR